MAMPRKPVTFTGNSPLAPLMEKFIQEKRACGYRYNECALSLRRFDAYLCRQGLQQVASSLCTCNVSAFPLTCPVPGSVSSSRSHSSRTC